jgi:hypothetical protein
VQVTEGATAVKRRVLLTTLAAGVAARPAPAASAGPVAVELFTSQGCSSCPPADAFLSDLARSRPDVLALAFHVTYWNGLGWLDPFSLEAATSRQRRYARLLSTDVYTPQMVVDGVVDVVGSNRPAALAAITAAVGRRSGPAFGIAVRDNEAVITIGDGNGAGDILLLGYDRMHRSLVGRGENAGRTLTEANIVRSLAAVGAWGGAASTIAVPVPQGEICCALLQAADGRILAAARAG